MIHPHFSQALDRTAILVSRQLETILSPLAKAGESARPDRLIQAMRHGVLNGGKRIRPFLLMQSAALFGVAQDVSIQTACALECLHCYSLVHDDLPAMDDDDLRRGKPTVHKAYDEATAILAGDALLTLAFELVADEANHADPAIRAELSLLLARAAGMGGMIGGQMLDIAAETTTPDEAGIRLLQSMKTGALIRYACEAGAVLGAAEGDDRQRLTRFGEIAGLAFQLTDDLLDATASSAAMGKATGKDAARGKGTLVGLYGAEGVQTMLVDLAREADTLLEPFGAEGNILRQTARFIIERKN